MLIFSFSSSSSFYNLFVLNQLTDKFLDRAQLQCSTSCSNDLLLEDAFETRRILQWFEQCPWASQQHLPRQPQTPISTTTISPFSCGGNRSVALLAINADNTADPSHTAEPTPELFALYCCKIDILQKELLVAKGKEKLRWGA